VRSPFESGLLTKFRPFSNFKFGLRKMAGARPELERRCDGARIFIYAYKTFVRNYFETNTNINVEPVFFGPCPVSFENGDRMHSMTRVFTCEYEQPENRHKLAIQQISSSYMIVNHVVTMFAGDCARTTKIS
jgi:hypothetical protein